MNNFLFHGLAAQSEGEEILKDRLRILYYGAGWPTNIGNAFLDLGAMALLRMAAPHAEIRFASEMPRWFFAKAKVQKPWKQFCKTVPPTDHALDIAAITKCDLLVFVGMAMCEEFIKINGQTISAAVKNGASVLLLGAGASSYSPSEKEAYSRFLQDIRPLAFVSRDNPSFEMFATVVPCSYRGIDCGFFLPEAYQPFPLTLPPYAVINFDAQAEPVIDVKGLKVVYAHHDCWGPVPQRFTREPDTLISDIPFDYLSLYAQAQEVHSDRVHACVAALSYGNKARLYSPTPRGNLFDAAGISMVRSELYAVDHAGFTMRKEEQVAVTRKIIKEFAERIGKDA